MLLSIFTKLCTFLSGIPFFNKKLYTFSKLFVDVFRGYSYDFTKNGELWLIKRCSDIFKDHTAVIFDVGANKGDWTQFVKQNIKQSSIHCFELSPPTFSMLSQNLADAKNVILNNVGLSDKAGEVFFTDYGEGRGHNTLVESPSFFGTHNTKKTRAAITTGTTYMAEKGIQKIDFLKIDVEGWEYFVLKGFTHHLNPQNIPVIQFEYGYASGDVHILMRDFYMLLESVGYRVGRLTPWGVHFSPFHYSFNDFKSGPNYIACSPDYADKLDVWSYRGKTL